jgi:hypothetical protein
MTTGGGSDLLTIEAGSCLKCPGSGIGDDDACECNITAAPAGDAKIAGVEFQGGKMVGD